MGQASHMESLYLQALQLTPHCQSVLGEGDSQHGEGGTDEPLPYPSVSLGLILALHHALDLWTRGLVWA